MTTRYNRATLEQVFKDMNIAIRPAILEHYGTTHQPDVYNSGIVEIHGLHQKTSNKWIFKQCMIHKIGYKVSKFDHGIKTSMLPMLYSYSDNNVDYMFFVASVACEYLNNRLEELDLYPIVTSH